MIAAVRLAHPTRVGIDGVDGAGKTALADELVPPLERMGRQVIRASVDGFHNPREIRYRRGIDSAEGYFLDSFDYPALKSELLDPLGRGGSRRYRIAIFDHRRDELVETPQQTAADDAVLLVDGVFLQRPELVDVWDLRIWVEAPFDVTVQRAISRDVATGAVNAAEIRAKYERRYVPGQLLYMNECHPREGAHVVVNNVDLQHPQLHYRSDYRTS